jgi:hypothetical protein
MTIPRARSRFNNWFDPRSIPHRAGIPSSDRQPTFLITHVFYLELSSRNFCTWLTALKTDRCSVNSGLAILVEAPISWTQIYRCISCPLFGYRMSSLMGFIIFRKTGRCVVLHVDFGQTVRFHSLLLACLENLDFLGASAEVLPHILPFDLGQNLLVPVQTLQSRGACFALLYLGSRLASRKE